MTTTNASQHLTFWPLARPYPSVVEKCAFQRLGRRTLAFSPDSRWLATNWEDDGLRLWPIGGDDLSIPRALDIPQELKTLWGAITFDPNGRYLVAVGLADTVLIVPLGGRAPCRRLPGPWYETFLHDAAVSPGGGLIATAFGEGVGPTTLRVFDIASGTLQTFPLPRPGGPSDTDVGVLRLGFLDEQTLLTAGWSGVWRWNLATGSHEQLAAGTAGLLKMESSDIGRVAVLFEATRVARLLDLATGAIRPLPQFGESVFNASLDPSGTVLATAGSDGIIRVGRLDGGEPHLLVGHVGSVYGLALSPDLRWVASAGEDDTFRLWPLPDLSKPPLHTLPHDELVAKLHSLTNLRAVRDPASPGQWKIEIGPFPGWAEVPTWQP